jgi:hypothetical protein
VAASEPEAKAGQADAVAACDEHAAVARGPVEDQAVVSLLVRILALVTERTAASRSARCARCRLARVLIEVVGELDQQWMIRARRPPGS